MAPDLSVANIAAQAINPKPLHWTQRPENRERVHEIRLKAAATRHQHAQQAHAQQAAENRLHWTKRPENRARLLELQSTLTSPEVRSRAAATRAETMARRAAEELPSRSGSDKRTGDLHWTKRPENHAKLEVWRNALRRGRQRVIKAKQKGNATDVVHGDTAYAATTTNPNPSAAITSEIPDFVLGLAVGHIEAWLDQCARGNGLSERHLTRRVADLLHAKTSG